MVGAFDDARILGAWERAVGLDRPWRELELLGAMTETPADALAGLPLGERNRRFLEVRRRVFGAVVDCEATCPACSARLEMSVDSDVVAPPIRRVTPDELRLAENGWTVSFRLPNSTDMAAALGTDDPAQVVLERCVGDAAGPGGPVDVATLPQAVRDGVTDRMAALDDGAELRLELACADCGHRWTASLDPAAVVFDEVAAHAARLMSEVDVLARAYGWREPDILALGPLRRRQYLEFVGG